MAISGFIVSVLSFIVLQALTGRLFFAEEPGLQDFTARTLFIVFFVGIACSLGYSSTYVLS